MRLADRNVETLAERLGAPVAIIESPEAALLGPDTLRGLGLTG
jgi:hypothetical protein